MTNIPVTIEEDPDELVRDLYVLKQLIKGCTCIRKMSVTFYITHEVHVFFFYPEMLSI